jgi:hypothetical protein
MYLGVTAWQPGTILLFICAGLLWCFFSRVALLMRLALVSVSAAQQRAVKQLHTVATCAIFSLLAMTACCSAL